MTYKGIGGVGGEHKYCNITCFKYLHFYCTKSRVS